MNSKKSLVVRRLIVYFIGVFIVALATNLSRVANLGLACGTALANELKDLGLDLSFKIGFFAMDNMAAWMFAVAVIVCLAQVVILRKEFKIYSLIQLVFAAVFSYFITFTYPLIGWCKSGNYFIRLIELVISLIVTGLGITFVVHAKLVPMPPESLALAIIKKFKKGTVGFWRICYDAANLVLALIFGWVINGSPLHSVNYGTVLCAFIPGFFVDIFTKIIGKPLTIACDGVEGWEAKLAAQAEAKAAKAAKGAKK